jgi:hypothetical protein
MDSIVTRLLLDCTLSNRHFHLYFSLSVFCCGKLDSQDGELDAILKELCALGSQFDQELKDEPSTRASTVTSTASLAAPLGN